MGAGLFAFNAHAASPLMGKLILQVQGRGEVWYANPVDQKAYLLPSDATEAYAALSTLATKVSQKELDSIPGAADKFSGNAATRSKYAGKWIKVGDEPDKIWYVGWKSKKKFYFDGTVPSFKYLHSLVTGALNSDISRLAKAEFNLPKKEAPAVETQTTIESAPATEGAANEATIAAPQSGFYVSSTALNTETYMMDADSKIWKPTMKLTFSKPAIDLVWHIYEVPGDIEVWNQKYPFEYEDNQAAFTLTAGNVASGKSYNYMIEATDKATGEQGKFYGTFSMK